MKTIWFGAMTCIASLVAGCSAFDEGSGPPRTAAVALGPTCGNGNLDPGEQCDDGNTADHDGCSAACVRELVTQFTFAGAAGTEATFAADLVDPELAMTPVISRGAGLIPSVAAGAFSASGWTTGAAIDPGDFYSFTVTPAAGNAMNLSSLQLDERRSGTGIRRWSVRSSLDGFATDIAVFTVPDDTLTRTQLVSLSPAFHDLTTSVELRIFGCQAEAAGGTWRVDNVTLIGDVSPPDTAPPQLVAFTVSPLVVDTTAGPATVTVHIEATDDRSGFGSGSTGNGSIDVRHSSDANPVGRGSLPLTSGTALHPSFDFTLSFPQASQPGSYPINLELIDNAFNHASFTPAALAARGMPSAIQVTSPSSP